jgi:hypothetical protein
MKTKLIPPDKKRCQAEKKTGCWPDARNFMAIGPPKMERCSNVPTVVVKEKMVAIDGRRGSMSLCDGCLETLLKQCGSAFVTVTRLKQKRNNKK